jgi:hypothetical protein
MIPGTNATLLVGKARGDREAVVLRPKRRFKVNQQLARKDVADARVMVPAISPLRHREKMKRSGRVHQQWRTPSEFCAPVPKLPAAPALHELVGLFIRVCLRPVHLTSISVNNFRQLDL